MALAGPGRPAEDQPLAVVWKILDELPADLDNRGAERVRHEALEGGLAMPRADPRLGEQAPDARLMLARPALPCRRLPSLRGARALHEELPRAQPQRQLDRQRLQRPAAVLAARADDHGLAAVGGRR